MFPEKHLPDFQRFYSSVSCSVQGRVIIPEAFATFTTILGSLLEFLMYLLNNMGKECLTFHLLDREKKHLKISFYI